MNREKNMRYMTTHQNIQEAILTLSKEKKKVTVNKICAYAGINRSAFYLHYSDITALLEEIQNRYFDELKEQFLTAGISDNIFCLKGYEIFCSFVREHREFYSIYFENHTAFPVEDGREDLLKNAEIYLSKKEITLQEEVYYRLCAVQSAMVSVLREWVRRDCDLSSSKMAKILSETVRF